MRACFLSLSRRRGDGETGRKRERERVSSVCEEQRGGDYQTLIKLSAAAGRPDLCAPLLPSGSGSTTKVLSLPPPSSSLIIPTISPLRILEDFAEIIININSEAKREVGNRTQEVGGQEVQSDRFEQGTTSFSSFFSRGCTRRKGARARVAPSRRRQTEDCFSVTLRSTRLKEKREAQSEREREILAPPQPPPSWLPNISPLAPLTVLSPLCDPCVSLAHPSRRLLSRRPAAHGHQRRQHRHTNPSET